MKLTTKIAAVILNSAFLILNSSCYVWWEEKVPMDSETPQINLPDFLYEEKEITALESPVQVMASQGLYKDSIKLRWEEVSNATSYRIERAVMTPDSSGNYTVPEEGDFEVLEKYVYSTTYEDKILSSANDANEEYSNQYYYRICAENLGKGYESSPYTDINVSETLAKGWLLSPPKNLSADKGKSDDSIEITWDSITGITAKNYIIYRGQNPKGLSMEEIATVRGNQTFFVNEISESEQGIEFYYKVCAELPSGSKSAFSGLALGYSLKYGAPTSPAGVEINDSQGNSTTGITVKWDNTSVTPTGTQTLTWSVYRTSSIDSSYTLIKTNLPAETSSIVDSDSLKPGVYYNYYIQAVIIDENGEKIKSPFSQTGPGESENAVAFILSCPSDIEIADSSEDGKVIIRWTPAIGSEAPFNKDYSYNIYYDVEQNGTFSIPLETNLKPELHEGWYEATVEKQPFYKISTVNEDSTESDKSATFAPNPDAPTHIVASKTSALDGLSKYQYNTNEVYPVKITWEKPANDNPYGYNIYRSTKPDSSFRKLNEEPITGTLSYTDNNETARAGTYYYYKVVSINVLGQGKKSNDPTNDPNNDCRGYGAITRDQWFREYNKSIMSSQAKLTLMHKSNDMDKLGSETINGNISGTLSYKAAIAGLGAEITMHYQDYCDAYIGNDPALGKYFVLTGNTDTTSNMSANGNMHEKVTCTGMYPGYAVYNNLEIKGGAAGGGYYLVQTNDLSGATLLNEDKVNWLVGEEH